MLIKILLEIIIQKKNNILIKILMNMDISLLMNIIIMKSNKITNYLFIIINL